MFVLNGNRINIYAPYTAEDGTRYDLTLAAHRELVGVEHVPDPLPPEDYSEDVYQRYESDQEPYVTYKRRSQEEIDQIKRSRIAPVSKFQAKAALHLSGHLEAVESLMQNPDTPVLARLAWENAQEFRRDSPTVLAMAQALDLTDSNLDELFQLAATIQA